MAIKFVKGCDLRVDHLNAVIYGFPNAGKTTLALTASRPVLLDFDRGAHRAANKADKAIVPVTSWKAIDQIQADDLQEFDTVVIDTVGTCLDFLEQDIIANDPSKGPGGTLTLQGYGVLKTRFERFLTKVRLWNKDLILVAHLKEEKKKEDVVERIVALGSSRDLIYQASDIMGRISIDEEGRYLSFNPTVHAYAKNVGLQDMRVDLEKTDTMARILEKAKQRINEEAADFDREHQRLEQVAEEMKSLEGNLDQFNQVLERMKSENAKPADKKLFLEIAKSKGFVFDRGKGVLVIEEEVF